MIFKQLLDYDTFTYTYILADEETKEGVIIDPVLEQVDRDYKLIQELGIKIKYIIDTHVHAVCILYTVWKVIFFRITLQVHFEKRFQDQRLSLV